MYFCKLLKMMIMTKGTLIPIGGNEDKGNTEHEQHTLEYVEDGILSRVVSESGGPEALIVVIPTASSIPEEVGQNYLESYFKTIKHNLSDGGMAAIQAITIDDSLFDRYKNKQDFIQKYIFPGGFLPNKNTINKLVSNNGLIVNSYNSYADHYADTLAIWKNEFNKKWDLIKNQGFDLTFKRMWDFYLSYCEAGFKSKNIDLIQFSLQNK